jgi:hypothetical protein
MLWGGESLPYGINYIIGIIKEKEEVDESRI